MTSPRFIPADEAKRLREGVTPGPWRWYWDHGIIALEGADTMPIATDLHVNDSDILTAAPDLAATVIAQAEQIETLSSLLAGAEKAATDRSEQIKRLQAAVEYALYYSIEFTSDLIQDGIITEEDME